MTLAKAVAGVNSAIEAKDAVNLSPFRARCFCEFVGGMRAGARAVGVGCSTGVAGPRWSLWVGLQ